MQLAVMQLRLTLVALTVTTAVIFNVTTAVTIRCQSKVLQQILLLIIVVVDSTVIVIVKDL
jgi:hypothetical protein